MTNTESHTLPHNRFTSAEDAHAADMYTALADTRAVLDNPTVDQHYSWLTHATDTELEARYKAHCWHI